MSASTTPDHVNAFAQLGRLEDERWTPLGGGFLLLEADRPWLVTSRTALDAAGDQGLVAWVGNPGTVVAITQALAQNGLEWVRHPKANVAACPFPLDPTWNVKAFSRDSSLPTEQLVAGLETRSLGSPYGFDLGGRPPTLLLDGILASVERERRQLITTAPLLPLNDGAPLLVSTAPLSLGGTLLLAGLLAQTLPVRPPVEGMVPPHLVPSQLHLALAHPIDVVFELLGSEPAQAQLAKIQQAT